MKDHIQILYPQKDVPMNKIDHDVLWHRCLSDKM